ncbi:MAG: tetratricopeptide repeat protein [Candidatus Riflebacteria bacterium]|nr:tetratricopeptide repeat protein [Candidatus Riflebacteria bacterium]
MKKKFLTFCLCAYIAAVSPAAFADQTFELNSPPQKRALKLIQEGVSFLISDKDAEAEQKFLQAKAADPYSAQAYNFLGLLYMKQELYQKAEAMLNQAVAIEPMYPEALRNLGKLYLNGDEFGKAANCLKKALSQDRNQPFTWYLYGMALYFSGHLSEAVEAYETAFALEPALPLEAVYNLAVAYHETGRFFEAVKQYERVVKGSPGHVNSLNNMGLIFSVMGEKERAIEAFKAVLAIDASNVKARINLGNVFLSQKDLAEAEKIYRSAISIDKTDISPRLNLGVVFYEKGDLESANQEWNAILQDNPDNIRVLSVMGSAYLEKHEYDKAIEVFDKMAEIMPENASVSNTLGYLLAEKGIELEKAEKLIEKALRLDKTNRATYYDSLAWLYYRQGKFEKALKIQKRALNTFRISHEKISSDVHYHLGKIHEKMDNFAEAQKAYELAIKSNTDETIVAKAKESLAALPD